LRPRWRSRDPVGQRRRRRSPAAKRRTVTDDFLENVDASFLLFGAAEDLTGRVVRQAHTNGERPLSGLTVGLDIAKHVFQVHAVDASGQAVHRRKLKRSEVLGFFGKLEPGLIGIEACGTAHHWGPRPDRAWP
jgi:hypothetical protein